MYIIINGDKENNVTNVFILVFSIFVLHIILNFYLVAICTNYLLIKYNFREQDLFQVNTMSHTFVTIIDVILICCGVEVFFVDLGITRSNGLDTNPKICFNTLLGYF